MKKLQRSLIVYALLMNTTVVFGQNNAEKAVTLLAKHDHKNAIKINLLSPFYGTVNLSWQKVLTADASFQLTASYMDFDSYGSSSNENSKDNNYETTTTTSGNFTTETTLSKTVNSQRTQGFAITPEYRYMLNGRNLTGIYIAPFLRYMYYEYSRDLDLNIQTQTYPNNNPFTGVVSNFTTTTGSDLYTYHTLGLGATVGKQVMFKNKVVIDVFAGPVYSILLSSNTSVTSTSDIVIGAGIPNVYIRGYGVRAGISVGLAY